MSAGVRRFYDKVGVRCAAAVGECVGRQPGACSWLVTLDGRDLRTPAKKLLVGSARRGSNTYVCVPEGVQ